MVSRTVKLAKHVIKYCLNVKPKETVIISGSSEAEKFIEELYKEIILAKANPLVSMHPKNLDYFFFKHSNNNQLKDFPSYWYNAIKKADAYIEVDTQFNPRELSSCSPKKIEIREKIMEPILEKVFGGKGGVRNVVVAYPCLAHAIEAEMSLDEWEDFVFLSCLIDWKQLSKKYEKIAKKFHHGEEVHVIGENIDLKFSIKDKNALLEDGKENVPGGEIYMAPVKKTMNGFIKFEFPSFYNGREIKDIFLRFKNGKVIEANAKKNEQVLRSIIKSDKNASYVGEFGIGINPMITKYTNNLLFDEKISGTIHIALGMSYEENGGGNDSMVHWDLVKDMKNARIILDNKVVQENGKWKI